MSSRILWLGDSLHLAPCLVLEAMRGAGLELLRPDGWGLQRPFPLKGNKVDAELLEVLEFNSLHKGADIPNRHRHAKAWLASIERVVLTLPACPTEWAMLGALWSRPSPLRLAVLLDPASQLQAYLPLMLEQASLVTTELERVVAWCQGRLFQSMMPPERGGKGPR